MYSTDPIFIHLIDRIQQKNIKFEQPLYTHISIKKTMKCEFYDKKLLVKKWRKKGTKKDKYSALQQNSLKCKKRMKARKRNGKKSFTSFPRDFLF